MKGWRLTYLLLAFLLALQACDEKVDPTPVQPESNVYIDTLICVGGEAATYRFSFFSRNSWKATVDGSPEWCTVSPKDGGSGGATLGVKLSENYDSCTRTATVRISSATHTGTIVIKQEQLDILDLTSVDKSTFNAPGGSFVINVDANIGYSLKIDSPWIECIQTKALNHDKLHFTVDKNAEGVERVARIAFSGGGIDRVVTITQHPAQLECETRDTIVPQAGKITLIRVKSNVSYDIVMPPEQCLRLLESAFTEITADGVETYNLYKFEMDANPEYYARELNVLFRNDDYAVCDTLTFTQERIDLFASSPEPAFSFDADSLSFILDFDAGSQFDCDSGCDWVTLEAPSGKPFRRIIHIAQNHMPASRSCRIALYDAGSAKAIEIFQEKLEMSYSSRRFEYAVGGGRDTLFFKHNIDYELTLPQEEWCSIVEEEPGTFVLRIDETAEEQPRECNMVFVNEHFQIADTIVIRQDQKDVLKVSPQKIDVPSAGEEVEVHVHANIPYEYVVEGNPEWVRESIDKSSDTVKLFYVRRNPDDADRQARIVFTGNGFKQTVTLLQRHPTMVLNGNEVNFTDDGGVATIGLDANVECEVKASPADWLSARLKDNTLEISAKANEGMERRTGEVVVFNSFYGLADTVKVSQSAKDVFSLAQKQFQFDPYGGVCKVEVLANVNYTYRVEEECDWIAESSVPLTFNVGRNTSGRQRVGRIVFTDGKSATEVTVTQDAAILSLAEEQLEFDTEGGVAQLEVESNVKYTLSLPACFWLQASLVGGLLKVEALANESEQGREAEVSLSAPEFGLEVKLPVSQRQKDVFTIGEKEFGFPPAGGTFTISLHTNLDYTVKVENQPLWLKSNGKLSFTVGKNTTGKEREAVIRIDASGRSERVKVMQEAPLLQVSADSCRVAAEGGTVSFTVKSNIEFTEDLPSESWVARTDAAEGEYAFVVAENAARVERETYAIFSTDYGLDHMVKIVQDAAPQQETPDEPDDPVDPVNPDEPDDPVDPVGPDEPDDPVDPVDPVTPDEPYIYVSKTTCYFSGRGGSAEMEVDSNVPFELSEPDKTWITHTTEGNVVKIAVTANPLAKAREGKFVISSPDCGISYDITVVQSPKGGILSPSGFEFGPEGGEVSVKVYADSYEYQIEDSPGWLHDLGELKFAVDSNFTGTARECMLRFDAGGVADSLKISQKAAYLEVSPETLEDIDYLENRLTFRVISNGGYRILAPDWVYVMQGAASIEIDVEENSGDQPRKCEISVVSDFGIVHTYTFTQNYNVPPPQFIAKQESYGVPPLGGEVTVETTPSDGVRADPDQLPSYMVEEKKKGSDSTVVFKVSAASEYREWSVTLLDAYGQKVKVKLAQAAPLLTLSSSSRLFTAEGGESMVTVKSNFDYQVHLPAGQPWISYRKGENEGEYWFVAAPNDTGQERSASITVGDTLAGVVRTLKVTQKENVYLNVDPELLSCDWSGGEFYINLESNADVTAKAVLQSGEEQWFTVTATDQTGLWLVAVDTNLKYASRAASVTCGAGNVTKSVQLRQSGYRKEGLYYSEDFSADLTVKTIQQATEGNGIDIVLMGDAFSDRQINAGTYDSLMNASAECLFAIEPYKSFRHLFNIYSVTAVSPTEVYEDCAATALSTYFSSGTMVGGDETMVKHYARAALSEERMTNAVIVVLMNKPVYAGTTYFRYATDRSSDYGRGYAIAYIPLCTSEEQFCQVLQHEVDGHAFGKLEDEYAYQRNGAIPYQEVINYRAAQRMGYYKNVDFVSDSTKVLWTKFLSDENFKDEGLGVFEGACTYWTGAYRPTESSIMRYNTDGFNAPSREAIYYRMFRLAYGEEAEYDFDDFVEYDKINRTPATKSGRASSGSGAPPPGFVPLAHPVVQENLPSILQN